MVAASCPPERCRADPTSSPAAPARGGPPAALPRRYSDHVDIARSLSIFMLAGLCEIGGGYLIWISLRDGKPAWLGVAGGVALALYGVVAAFQPANFGRVYAAYGGVFIAMALAWGWLVDDVRPDRFDLLGPGLALAGVLVIMYAPRT